MRILIVKLSSLGDVVHTMPAVQDMRRALPHAQIDWVVDRGFAPLVQRCEGVARVIECDLRRWRKAPFTASTRAEWQTFKQVLQAQAYDAVIDLQGLSKSALVAWLARLAPNGKRYAMANQTEGSGYEAPTRWVADVAITMPAHIHAVQRGRLLCAKIFGYEVPNSKVFGLAAQYPVAQAATETIAIEISSTQKIQHSGSQLNPNTPNPACIALVHGTSRADKQWPLDYWVALGKRLQAAGYTLALLHGTAEEQQRSEALAAELPGAVVWPRLSLDALTDALAPCAGVIGVDSGLSHIAVALDLPHVQLYNFDTAWRTGPLNRTRQRSVFAQPAPTVDAVWQAWLEVSQAPVSSFPRRRESSDLIALDSRLRGNDEFQSQPPIHRPFALTLYSSLTWLLQPLLRRKLHKRGQQEPGYLQAVEERFGHYTQAPFPADGHTVWLHAVSLGETRAAAVLIARLRAQWPHMRLLLTHGTATGRAQGLGLLQPGDVQVWQPWDTPAAVARFLVHFKPRIGILMETEVWPNLTAACAQMGVPLVLANARMSEKSMRQALRFSSLSRPAYQSLAAVWAQTPGDAQRLQALGARVQGVFGNVKFDASPQAEQLAQGRAWRAVVNKPVLMFASSREGEEDALLQVLASQKLSSPAQWLIVPRHPQRFDEVATLIRAQGFTVSRRSAWANPPTAADLAADVWLGDSLGEMALYYGLSDAALLGGSFEPLGGQNLIEAAACGCPLFMGTHTFNFAKAAELAVSAGAARREEDMAAAVTAATALVSEPARQATMAQAADRFAKTHQGATDKTVAAVLTFLNATHTSSSIAITR
jgi:3-deoxy-D-manno-octulosonic-acid transferase